MKTSRATPPKMPCGQHNKDVLIHATINNAQQSLSRKCHVGHCGVVAFVLYGDNIMHKEIFWSISKDKSTP